VLLLHQTLIPVIKLGTLWYLTDNLHHTRKRKRLKTDLAFHKFIIYFVHLGKPIIINLGDLKVWNLKFHM
jgi:hypothetical protein